MANRSWTFEECKNHFNEQEERIRENMAEREEYAHCIDREYFGGSCYDPAKVVTSNGRVWSLRENDFIDETANTNDHGYRRVSVSGSASDINKMTYMSIHKLVANYFCDKRIIKIMEKVNKEQGEELFDLSVDQYGNYRSIQVHHINHNKIDNRAENLQYIYADLHDVLTALHNQNSLSEVTRGKSLKKLEAIGLSNPEDRGIKIMLDNATEQGNKLYGYIVDDASSPKGYTFKIGITISIKGDPNYKVTEEEIIKMLAITRGRKPDVVGTFSLKEETEE